MADSNEIACLQDIEDIAVQRLDKNALDFYRTEPDQMVTLKDNITSFQKYFTKYN